MSSFFFTAFFPILFLIIIFPDTHGYFSSYNSWEFMFPIDVMSQIYAIEANESLSLLGKEKSINAIISQQIDYSQRSKLQLPSLFTGLPSVAQWQIKDVFYHPNLTFEEKQSIIDGIITQLPEDQQILPPKDKCGEFAREKSMFFDTYSTLVYSVRYTIPLTELKEKLPESDFERIFDALQNNAISMKQKRAQITDILSLIDADSQQRLFQLSGPMDVEPFQQKLLNKFREELKTKVGTKMPTSSTPEVPAISSSTKKLAIFGTKIETNLNFAKLKKLMG